MEEMFRMMRLVILGSLMIVRVTIGVAVFVVKWVWQRFKKHKGPTTHGDASWATDKQLQEAGNMNPGGFLLAFTKSAKPVYGKQNRGALVLAGPGAGKSQMILANFAAKKHLHYEQRPHLVVHDPAGELFALGKPILEALGYEVAKIDLVNP